MKLVMAIVHNDDAGKMVDALLEREYRATRLASSGGFLRKSNATILVGVEAADVDDVIAVIRSNSRSRTQQSREARAGTNARLAQKVDVRAAVVFVIPIDRFDRV